MLKGSTPKMLPTHKHTPTPGRGSSLSFQSAMCGRRGAPVLPHLGHPSWEHLCANLGTVSTSKGPGGGVGIRYAL